MIRVTVEYIPHGVDARKREIGTLELANTADHPERPAKGNYTAKFRVEHRNGDVALYHRSVLDFARTEYNVWALILLALHQLAVDSSGIPNGEPFEP